MNLAVNLLPLILILTLLILRKHMLVAGLAGGVLAMLIGSISIETASQVVVDSIASMLAITVPILYAAAAAMVSKAGSVEALVGLAEKHLKGRKSLLAGVIVLIQAFATYMAGMAAGNTMVTAPLMLLAAGAVPEVMAAMAVASAIGITTSPASTETILAAASAGRDVVTHARFMFPLTILFYACAALLAVAGVSRRGTLLYPRSDPAERSPSEPDQTLLLKSVPAAALLVMVLAGSWANDLMGIVIFTPPFSVMVTAVLTVICTSYSMEQTAAALIEGSRFILTTLFSVGLFLAFINLIAMLGTFEQLSELVTRAPEFLLLPSAMLMAFLIAVPAGALAAGVLALILPTLSLIGLPPAAMGFVAVATGLGCQISPVQINVVALSEGFRIPVMQVVKNNLKYVSVSLIALMLIALLVV
jgi:hypothetical protein